MSYDGIIKTYAAGTPSVVNLDLTGKVAGFKFTLDVRHICQGGTLGLLPDDPSDAFALAHGEIVRAFYSSSDTVALWAGTVVRRERDVRGDTHAYELAGLWRGLEGVTVTTAKTWTSASVATIAAELFDTYVGGIVALIVDDTSGIIAPGVLTNFVVKVGDEVTKIFDALAELAPGTGEAWAWGVDGGGDFLFRAISAETADLQVDAQVLTDVTAAREIHNREPRQQIVVVGDYDGSIGARAKKGFTTGDGAGRRLICQVPGICKQADLERFATNWLAKNAEPSAQVTGLGHVMDDDATPPQPQNGQARYQDAAASIDRTDFIKKIDVNFGELFDYSLSLGLSGSGDDPTEAADPYSPAALDSFLGGGGSDYAALAALPEATDLTPLPNDFPRRYTPSDLNTRIAAEAGSAGGSGVGKGHLINLYPQGPFSGEVFHVICEIENGGTEFALNQVRFHARHTPTGGTAGSPVMQYGEKIGQHGSVEIWKTKTGLGPYTGEGEVRLAVSAIVETDPSDVIVCNPADVIADTNNWDDCPGVRLAEDAADSVAVVTTLSAGWLARTI